MRQIFAAALFAVSALGWLSASAQVSSVDRSASPVPAVNAAEWIKSDDIVGYLAAGKTDAIRLILAVSANGRVDRCDIVHSSGIGSLDKTICQSLTRRGQFQPATDASGGPVNSELSHVVLTSLNPGQESIPDPRSGFDIILGVNKLPGNKPFLSVDLREMIDVAGKVESCTVAKPSGAAALDSRACQMVAGSQVVRPLTDEVGKPVRGMRIQRIGFLTDAALAGESSTPAKRN